MSLYAKRTCDVKGKRILFCGDINRSVRLAGCYHFSPRDRLRGSAPTSGLAVPIALRAKIAAKYIGEGTAGTPIATSLTVTSDAGGVTVRWIVDPNLVSGVTSSVTLICTQGAGDNALVNQTFTQQSSYFVEADQSAPVQCSVTTKPSDSDVTLINQPAISASATADEESVGGLPVWLLYIVTQPE